MSDRQYRDFKRFLGFELLLVASMPVGMVLSRDVGLIMLGFAAMGLLSMVFIMARRDGII